MTTKRQDALLARIRNVPQGNNFWPAAVYQSLMWNSHLWTWGRWNRKTMTLYLFPRKGQENALKLFAKSLKADEIDYVDLLDYRNPIRYPDGSVDEYPVLATGGLRIWWD